MSTPLLTTKLYMPPIRPELVPRPQLLDRLEEGMQRKLILISAPAGFGKTTLVSNWLRERAIPTAWISLEESDNDPVRFLAYFFASLQTVHADIGKDALKALESPQAPAPEVLLTEAINQINALLHDLVLVLDDYHLITARPVHEAITFLLDHQPSHMHLVIATRADPPLSLARLRGRGQLTELRQTDLRFSLDEATAFLNQVMALDLSSGDIAALTSRTEGWITGLQMAALALQSAISSREPNAQIAAFIQAFAGTNRYILDYLMEEVLERQPAEVQAFLLRTVILSRMTGPLCDALLGLPDSGQEIVSGELEPTPSSLQPSLSGLQLRISNLQSPSQRLLEQLESANLFIVPLDDERRWYRYHRLFADLLRRRLRNLQPEGVPMLHRRASAWYERNGLVAEAIDHALAADDLERAADLIEQVAEATLMRSQIATFLQWIDALPEELVRSRPTLCLLHAWALLWSGQPLQTIEARLRQIDADGNVLVSQVGTLRGFLAAWQGRVSRASDLSRQALEELPEDASFLRSIAAWNLGVSYLLEGDDVAGQQVFTELARLGQQRGNILMAVNALTHLAELQMSLGRLRVADDLYRQALAVATDRQARRLPISGMPLIGLGDLSREWNDLEAATRYLSEGIERLQEWGEFSAIDGYISLARVKQAQGDVEGACAMMHKARQVALQFDVTELDDLLVAVHQVRLWLLQGNLEPAIQWLEARGLPSGALHGTVTDSEFGNLAQPEAFSDSQLRNYESLLLARILIAQQRPAEALPRLAAHEKVLEERARHRSRRMLEVQFLKALAYQALDQLDQSLLALDQALAIAEPEGFVRIFLDEGEPMIRLLRQAASRGLAPQYVSRLIASSELHKPAAGAEVLPHQDSLAQPLIEPLSEREMEVLRLLATGLSNPEIAEQLYIATSTVRSHLKSIYGKLNVHKRWDAVYRAEELGLL